MQPISGATTSVTAFLGSVSTGPLQTPVHITSFADYQLSFGPPDQNSELGFAVQLFFLNGGTAAYVVNVSRLDQTAISALDAIPGFNLLCLPGVTDATVLALARDYCEKRRAFLIIDAPSGATTVNQLKSFVTGPTMPHSTFAAVYAPWLLVPNPVSPSTFRTTAPSGAVAGIYARTDTNAGVWKAPAGITASLHGTARLAANLTDADASNLQPSGLNLLRSIPTAGLVVWGARTLDPTLDADSEYKYVPVRRLSMFIEQSIISGLQGIVLEPNAPPLWAEITQVVQQFLQGLFREGAFQGTTPAASYFVQCSAASTTQSDIDKGIVNIIVGFAPLRPAEFVIIAIQALAARPPHFSATE